MLQNAPILNQVSYSDGLHNVILRKRKLLVRLMKRFEKLNTQIQLIQKEYDLRIGSLFRKSSLLQREIDHSRTLIKLLQEGLTYEDALQEIYKESSDKKDAWNDFFIPNESTEPQIQDNRGQLRKLWRKLVQKHHPDLSIHNEDKKRREELTKLINNAYAVKDFKLLKSIEEKELVEDSVDINSNNLETVLVDIENAIIRITTDYKDLRKSEWYSWRRKTKKEKDMLFHDLERGLIREILQKELLLSQLKRKHQLA